MIALWVALLPCIEKVLVGIPVNDPSGCSLDVLSRYSSFLPESKNVRFIVLSKTLLHMVVCLKANSPPFWEGILGTLHREETLGRTRNCWMEYILYFLSSIEAIHDPPSTRLSSGRAVSGEPGPKRPGCVPIAISGSQQLVGKWAGSA